MFQMFDMFAPPVQMWEGLLGELLVQQHQVLGSPGRLGTGHLLLLPEHGIQIHFIA